MRELIRTNDAVLVSAVVALLESAGIKSLVLDQNMSVLEGSLDAQAFNALKVWIELNRETLIAYWEGEIHTQDALEALQKVGEK